MSEEVKEETPKEEKKIKAKDASLWGQIVAAVWIAGFGSFYIVKNINTLDPFNIIWFGIAIMACFSPVYANLIIEKFCKK